MTVARTIDCLIMMMICSVVQRSTTQPTLRSITSFQFQRSAQLCSQYARKMGSVLSRENNDEVPVLSQIFQETEPDRQLLSQLTLLCQK